MRTLRRRRAKEPERDILGWDENVIAEMRMPMTMVGGRRQEVYDYMTEGVLHSREKMSGGD